MTFNHGVRSSTLRWSTRKNLILVNEVFSIILSDISIH